MASRTIKVENIVGLSEVASRCGSTPHAVWNWTQRPDFPEPITRVSNKPVWNWLDIDKWNKSWVRSKGGSPTHKSKSA